MKRTLLIVLGLALLCPSIALAEGTISDPVVTKTTIDGKVQRISLAYTCTADSAAATYPNKTIDPATYGITGWYLYQIVTNPGATGPTNGAWDLDITDAGGFLITQNLVDDRSSTATQRVIMNTGYPIILGNWTMTIGDNAVNSAVVVVTLTFVSN